MKRETTSPPLLHSAEEVCDALVTDYMIRHGFRWAYASHARRMELAREFNYFRAHQRDGVLSDDARRLFFLRYHCRQRGEIRA